jgi:acyl carrier protein
MITSTNGAAETQTLSMADAIRRFISDVFFVDGFAADASFLGESIVDSTGMLELVMFVETTCGFQILDTELVPENFDTLNRILAFIIRKTRE